MVNEPVVLMAELAPNEKVFVVKVISPGAKRIFDILDHVSSVP